MGSRFTWLDLGMLGLGVLVPGIAMAQAATAGTNQAWTRWNPVTPLTAQSFAHPSMSDRPWVRMNTPDGLTSDELKAEVDAMAASGIGGVEIGQGTFPATPQLIAILQEANRKGLKVSLSHGSTTAPKGYSLDEDNVRKTLLFTASDVKGGQTAEVTFKAPLPPVNRGFGGGGGGGRPAPPPQPRRSTLIAVMAYKCVSSCDSGVATLDFSSAVDVTSQITGKDAAGVGGGPTTGKLAWKAPSEGDWKIIAFWSQGANAQPDLFSKAGTDELIRGMESDWTPDVKALLRANGGDIFYDSHSADRGSPTELWTNNMEAEFKELRGYSLLQSAAALFPQNFMFSDGSAERVRNDLNAMRTQLWIENHLKPMRAWAHGYNLRLRLQPYGEVVATTPDEIEAASVLDRPETESLFFGDEVDSFLPIAAANHMTGNTWYSTECCAAVSKAYAQTFQDAVIRMHREYVAGVTKLVYHVYPYRDAKDAKWPGYHSFGSAGFSNAWGPRNPNWIDANTYNDYFARTQQVLTQGTAKVDVAVYMLSYTFPQPMQVKGGFHIWPDTKLQEAGFTRDYLDPALLAMPSAVVTNHVLAANKAAYKVLILDGEQQPDANPERDEMPLATAQRILALAKAGLPIIVVGKAPDHVPGRDTKDDAAVKSAMDALMQLKNVHRVTHEGDVPALLLSLGIHPSAEPEAPSQVLSLRREDAARGVQYYFFYNQQEVTPPGEPANLFELAGTKVFDGKVTLHGQGKPYVLDAWSGAIVPLQGYEAVPGGVRVPLHIAADDAVMIALSKLPLTSSVAGAVVTAFGAGKTMDLTGARWHLAVEDWKPAVKYGATGVEATQTSKDAIPVELEGLKSWRKIPGLADVSGVGTYTTTLNLPDDWKAGRSSVLRLGEVMDSFQLKVNGKAVPANQISAAVEVGRYLHAGANTIEVRVATTLNNRLSQLDTDVRKRKIVQEYGLIGPVVLETAAK
ncbi:glycosyl hydrolase [Terriglobus sp. ADX1]|uniref:glycosyl hydrolase n=1 Tax=Terriglobus sp. ADX1 TaxID=2794063 RepID=UPI002FE59D97